MTQEEFNESTLKVLTQLTETLSDMGKTRDAMYQLIQLESSRVDSAEDKLDILMGERYSRIANEEAKIEQVGETGHLTSSADDIFRLLNAKEDFEESIENHLEREEPTITPKKLLKLGFIEHYQENEGYEPGYTFYSFKKHGIELTSSEVGGLFPLYVYTEGSHEINSLRTLGDLILSLTELK